MRLTLFFILILFQTEILFGQTSLEQIDLRKGEYQVGFIHYTLSDSTRTYHRIYDYTNAIIARPIPVSIWYPSTQMIRDIKPLKVIDYLEILKEEEEWEYLPNEQILNWFYYANTASNQSHLDEVAMAFSKIEFAKGKFPLVLYTPSYQASSIENFALCEYLASHGYIVASAPSRGLKTRWFSNNNAKELETQARDVEFLIARLASLPNADINRIAAIGFSFGGLSNVIAQMRNDNIKAVVSLDGTERYNYDLLNQSAFFDFKEIDVPYIHLAQKSIPATVLKSDNIDPELNTKFILYDSLVNSKAYRLKFHKLTHSYFSTLGVLFAERDMRQDKSDSEIMESYKWVSAYTLNFLNAYLKGDNKAALFIRNNPSDNGVRADLISKQSKDPPAQRYSFQDFNEMAVGQDYQNLLDLYESIISEHPSFNIPEGHLNTLGLQLVFNPITSDQGINVLLLATKLYPNSANLFDSLAEGYLFKGEEHKAIENFERSLELNSENKNAIDRLDQLKK